MSKVIVVDTRAQFLSDMIQFCNSFGAEVIQIAATSQFNEYSFALHDTVAVLWAEYPDVQGMNVPKTLMRAIAASRYPIPVVLYASQKEAFATVLEPGLFYPSSIVSAHACTVAGVVKRVMARMQTRAHLINSFEEWAFQTKASIAGTPGKVSVFAGSPEGGFETLGTPTGPFQAVGLLCQSGLTANGREAVFY